MKIGIVCYPTYGGSGVVATELGLALAAKGHQVHFITYSEPVRLPRYAKNIFFHEVTVADYPLFDYLPYELGLTSKLVDVAKYEKLDLLHVHYAIPHASAAYMARQILASQNIKVPFITTLHGTDITLVGRDASFEPVVNFSINESDAVTAVSKSLKEDTYNTFNIKRDIEVIPNFINLKHYANGNGDSLCSQYAPQGEKVMMHMSNFRKVKRVEDVVRVFDKVRKVLPAKLLMVGDGPERHKTESLCRKLDACNDIHFTGKVRDTAKFLNIADLFLITSETESFGLSALEAMACSVPVVSTNTGGQPEVNEHGFSGFLSSPGNVDDMAKNAVAILQSDDKLALFKQNALAQASKFDVEKILPMYEALYDKVIL
jgi:L-malate glycosyltransferase